MLIGDMPADLLITKVYFHRTSPGGCCDCGDEEAWAEEGCCDRHRRFRGDKGTVDPLASLPHDFEVGLFLVTPNPLPLYGLLLYPNPVLQETIMCCVLDQ